MIKNIIILIMALAPFRLHSAFKAIGCSDYLPYDDKTVLIIFNQMVDENSASIDKFRLNSSLYPTSIKVDANIIELKFNYIFREGQTNQISISKFLKSQNGEYIDVNSRSINFEVVDIEKAANYISDCVLSDGAVTIKKPSFGSHIDIIPYFATFAAFGLLKAYEISLKTEYLNKVKSFLEWYISHINPDGTIYDYSGTYPSYSPTGNMDSTDSYAALFILLCYKYYKYSNDKTFLANNYSAIKKIKGAIYLTLDTSDYLTYAKPGWVEKYFMDNLEVYLGLLAYRNIINILGKKEDLEEVNKHLAIEKESIANFYLKDYNAYAISKSTNGSYGVLTDGQYPYAMAQNFALYYFHKSEDELFGNLWATILSKIFSNGIVPEGELSGTFWWILNAKKIGDNKILKQCIVKFKNEISSDDVTSYLMGQYILAIYGDIMLLEDSEIFKTSESLNEYKPKGIVYPNPVRLNDGQVKIKLENFAFIKNIKIYDIRGDKIVEYSKIDKQLYEWDLRDYRGNLVSAGSYFCIIEDENGNKIATKLVIIK